MPELPEVETERGRLAARIEGKRIASARIDDARLTRPDDPKLVAARIEGDRVTAVERRGKYIFIRFESGHVLLVHLRMTGGFRYDPATHERAVLELDDGTRIAYRDLRRFGTWLLTEEDEAERHLAIRNGPEPLGRKFTTAFLAGRFAKRKAPLKAAILDQRTVAGLGNIYAAESLWMAKISPKAIASSISRSRLARLAESIHAVLENENRPPGRYTDTENRHRFQVYDREGKKCSRCGATIKRIPQAGRSTYFCPKCQRS